MAVISPVCQLVCHPKKNMNNSKMSHLRLGWVLWGPDRHTGDPLYIICAPTLNTYIDDPRSSQYFGGSRVVATLAPVPALWDWLDWQGTRPLPGNSRLEEGGRGIPAKVLP